MIEAYYRSSDWRYDSKIYSRLANYSQDERFMADLPDEEKCIALQIYDKFVEMCYFERPKCKKLSMKDDVGYHQLIDCMKGYLAKHKDVELEVTDHTGKPVKVRIVFENLEGWQEYENATHVFNGFSKTIKSIEIVDRETGKGEELKGCTEKFKGVAFTGGGNYGDFNKYLSVYEMTPVIDHLALVRNGLTPYAAQQQERKRQAEERKMEEEREALEKEDSMISLYEIKCGVVAHERAYDKKQH